MKEKNPAAILEFGPAGAAPVGWRRGGPTVAPVPGDAVMTVLTTWWLGEELATWLPDISDATIGPDGCLYLVSDQGQTKHIFRAAMRGIVPDAVLDRRDKIGFATPEADWLTILIPMARKWLREDLQFPFLKHGLLLREFESVAAGRSSNPAQVWRWINFYRWYVQAFNQQP